jgi:hypothetical protein
VSLHVELLEPEPGHFTVIVGGKFADHLCRDEALAVVAGALYCGTSAPPFLKSYSEWARWDQRYRQPAGQPFKPAALLTYQGARRAQ